MDEQEWLTAIDPLPITRWLGKRATARKSRLLGCCSVRDSVWALLVDERSTAAVEVSERFADGLVDAEKLARALRAAFDAAEELGHTGDEAYQPAAYALRAVVGDTERNLRVAILTGDPTLALARIRDIFGNPFRPVTFSHSWRTDTAVSLARGMYDARDFGAMPVLADALQDAGCDNEDVLNHCRDTKQVHVRGCWVVDLVLDKD